MLLDIETCLNISSVLIDVEKNESLSKFFNLSLNISKNIRELKLVGDNFNKYVEELKKPILEEIKDIIDVKEKEEKFQDLWKVNGCPEKIMLAVKEKVEVELKLLCSSDMKEAKVFTPYHLRMIADIIKPSEEVSKELPKAA